MLIFSTGLRETFFFFIRNIIVLLRLNIFDYFDKFVEIIIDFNSNEKLRFTDSSTSY